MGTFPIFYRGGKEGKNNKGLSLPPDLILGPSEAFIVEVGVKDGASIDMARATPIAMGEASKEREEEPATITETQAETNEAPGLVEEVSVRMTKAAT